MRKLKKRKKDIGNPFSHYPSNMNLKGKLKKLIKKGNEPVMDSKDIEKAVNKARKKLKKKYGKLFEKQGSQGKAKRTATYKGGMKTLPTKTKK